MDDTETKTIQIGEWLVRPKDGDIENAEGAKHLEPKVMDVLVSLAARVGEVVTRDELVASVWGRSAFSDEPLTRVIAELRKALGDSRAAPRYIETIPKRGYRLIADVSIPADDEHKPSGGAAEPIPAYAGDQPFVFVSYAHRDADTVYPELARLRRMNVNVWYDEGIPPGHDWESRRNQALETSAAVVLFVSPRSLETPTYLNDIDAALKSSKWLIPIELEPITGSRDFESKVSGLQVIPKHGLSSPIYEERLSGNVRWALAHYRAAREFDAGATVGQYVIQRQIGEGAFSVVYLAEQREPVRRKVALKVLKPGMDTTDAIGRFEAERQALAAMDHANVATVYEAGTTELGRLYFAMEYVPGDSIVDYANEYELTIRERIALFIQVCEAVQHSHHKGIIHRDLKPSNVLVTTSGDKAAVKVIDFGVAKAVNQRLGERTFFTEYGVLIGTLEYMSPEQAALGDTDVDTRTDVYSLGVLLFELLTGVLPFARQATYTDVQRAVQQHEPPRLSNRLNSLGDGGLEVAKTRRTDTNTLVRQFRGDLDWVVLKALEKNRARRYETPNALAMDLQRFLNDEPVEASPPSRYYRLKKLIKRNRLTFAAAAAVTSAVTFGAAVAVWGLYRAEQESLTATSVVEFLVETFRVPDPDRAGRADITAQEMLQDSLSRIETELAEQPDIQAELRFTLGEIFLRLGEFGQARVALELAIEHFGKKFGDRGQRTLEAQRLLSLTLTNSGEYENAVEIAQQALERHRAAHPDDYQLRVNLLRALAAALNRTGDFEPAENAYREALDVAARTNAISEETQLTLLSGLSHLYNLSGRPEEAVKLLASLSSLNAGVDPQTELEFRLLADLMTNLGHAYFLLRRLADSEALLAKAADIRETALGPKHPQTLNAKANLAVVVGTRAEASLEGERSAADIRPDFERATELLRSVWSGLAEILGNDHGDTLQAQQNYAVSLLNVGEFDEAIELLVDSQRLAEANLPPRHQVVRDGDRFLGYAYYRSGRLVEARPLIVSALATAQESYASDSPLTNELAQQLAEIEAALNGRGL